MLSQLCFGLIIISVAVVCHAQKPGDYDINYGTYVGDLASGGYSDVSGKVYIGSANAVVIRNLKASSNSKLGIFVGTSPNFKPNSYGTIQLALDGNGGGQLSTNGQDTMVLRTPAFSSLINSRALALIDTATGKFVGRVINFNPQSIKIPAPVTLHALKPLEHDTSSGPIEILNAKQIRINQLNYDGQGPDAFFWVGNTPNGEPTADGTIVPYRGSSSQKIPRFQSQTVELTLPADMTVRDINYVGLWCRKFAANFGYTNIPDNIVVPPAIVAQMNMGLMDRRDKPKHFF